MSSTATARCCSISASSAAIWSTRRKTRASARIACALLRQRAARRRLGEIPAKIRHSAHPGILCGDRRQCLALQRRRPGRRHRPRSALPRPSLSAGAGEKRRRLRRAGARRRRLLHPLRHRRSRRSARPHPRQRRCIGRRRSRATPAPRIPSGRSCATCSSAATPGIAPAI